MNRRSLLATLSLVAVPAPAVRPTRDPAVLEKAYWLVRGFIIDTMRSNNDRWPTDTVVLASWPVFEALVEYHRSERMFYTNVGHGNRQGIRHGISFMHVDVYPATPVATVVLARVTEL